jgi:hypothetical protein
VGSAKRKFGAAHGGSVRMFGVAATSGKIGRRALGRPACLGRDSLPGGVLTCLGHAVAGQHKTARLKAVQYRAARSVRTGSERYCKARIVGVRPAVAVAIFPHASNPGLAMRMGLHRRPAAGGTRSVTEAPGPVAPEDRHRPASHPLYFV